MMMRVFSLLCLCAFGLLANSPASLHAQDPFWGRKMFNLSEIEFGRVAKGSEAVVQVMITNKYTQDIQITSAATGCGCVKVDMKEFPKVIQSGQSIPLNVRLDTVNYDGQRDSKVTVSLFQPDIGAADSVVLPVKGYIRRDVVMQPGSVNFGVVAAGKGAEQRISINYAGRSDWQISQVRVNNKHITANIVEKSRGNGLVNYELTVSLKSDAPATLIRDQIVMVTDDANSPQLPLLVEGKIESDFVITDIQFGTVVSGQTKTQVAVVRGTKPFKIEKIQRTKDDTSFKAPIPDATSTVHALKISFTPPNEPGPFEEEFYVTVSGREDPITFKAKGRIAAPSTVAPAGAGQ